MTLWIPVKSSEYVGLFAPVLIYQVVEQFLVDQRTLKRVSSNCYYPIIIINPSPTATDRKLACDSNTNHLQEMITTALCRCCNTLIWTYAHHLLM